VLFSSFPGSLLRSRSLQLATAAYEAASAARPDDRALLEAVFFAHVREGALLPQQQAAMKLYKAQPSERHLLWVVTALLAQASQAGSATGPRDPPPAAAAPLLQLAEALLKRAAASGVLQSQAGLSLYLAALEGQGKPEEALALAQSPLSAACMALQSDRCRLTAQLAERCGAWPAARNAHEALLAENADDWCAFLGCADAMQRLAADSAAGLAEVDALVARLQAAGDAAGGPAACGRGPWLASVDAALRRLLSAEDSADPETPRSAAALLAERIAEHWRRFGEKPSCAADLSRYCRALRRHPPAAALLDASLAHSPPQPDAPKEALCASLRRAAAAASLRCDAALFEATSLENASALCAALAGDARRHAAVVRDAADIREGTAADGLFLAAAEAPALAACALLAQPSAAESRLRACEALLGSLCVASEGLAASPHSSPLRLAAAALLSLLGCGACCAAAMAPLCLRHVQHESLSHLLLPPLLCAPARAAFAAAHRALRELHAAHRLVGAGDMAVAATQSGAADKVLEFSEFAQRLSASHSRAAAQLEAALSAAFGAGAPPERAPAEAAAAIDAAVAAATPLCCAAAVAAMRFNCDLAVPPRFVPLPLQGWHCSVADWWRLDAQACEAAWPRRSRATPPEEGGGDGSRLRAKRALQARLMPLHALQAFRLLCTALAASPADAAQAQHAHSQAAQAAREALAASPPSLPSDVAIDSGVAALASLADALCTAVQPGAYAAAEGGAEAALAAFGAAIEASCSSAASGLAEAQWPPGSGLALAGGAMNVATAVCFDALGFCWTSLSLAAAAFSPKKVLSSPPLRLALAPLRRLAEALRAGAALLADSLHATARPVEEKQIATLCDALAALPSARGAPEEVTQGVARQLVTGHREACSLLEVRSRAISDAAGALGTRLEKQLECSKA